MRSLLLTLLCLSVFSESLSQTCDLVLAGYTPSAVEGGIHTFVIQFPNTENCGCNDYTQSDGSTCDQSGTTHVQNNETVSHIVMAIHYADEETGYDLGENTDCTSTLNHPGWSYVLGINEPPGGWSSGSATTIGIDVPYAWECILNNPIEGYCWEVVIWQINLSQTATYDDFPIDGWSAGAQGNGTQMYPDIDLSDNRIVICPDPVVTDTVYVYETDTVFVELPPDTITELLEVVTFVYDTTYVELPPDTVYVPWEWYFYDTVYVDVFDTIYINTVDTVIVTEVELEYVYITDTLEVPVVDTLVITQVDTLFQEIIIYEYVTETDTIYEYITQLVDCDTGLPCGDGFWEEDCRSVFVPNAFSPNNDGINDAFYALSESYTCWREWELTVYNRWGGVVWQTNDPEEYWYGQSLQGDYYAADGVYVWTLIAEGYDGLALDLHGSITLFR